MFVVLKFFCKLYLQAVSAGGAQLLPVWPLTVHAVPMSLAVEPLLHFSFLHVDYVCCCGIYFQFHFFFSLLFW